MCIELWVLVLISNSPQFIATAPAMSHFTKLPCELHYMVTAYLGPGDLFQLLPTNRLLYFRSLPSLHRLATEDKDGIPALHWAAARGHKPLAIFLLQKEVNINHRFLGIKAPGKTPLHLAASRGDIAMVKLLLERGANVNIQDSKRASALYLALGIESDNFRESYFAFYPEKQGRSRREHTQEFEEIIELLIHNGANPNYYANQKISSLHIAVITQPERIIRLLLDNGAKVDLAESIGCTPLHTLVSTRKGRVDKIVKLLLKYKANIKAVSFHADTPLHWAAKTANRWAVQALLECGANREARNMDGETALDCALAGCAGGEIIRLLEGTEMEMEVELKREIRY